MTQINAVPEPIINTPFDEPQHHWHIEIGKRPELREGRRLASYFFRVPERAARGKREAKQRELIEETSKGQEYLLDNANLIRQRIKEWRAQNYDGATRVTKELLVLWRSEDRKQRLFFAQVEAAETVIFLIEAREDLRLGIKVPPDQPGPQAKEAGYKGFLRYALKMATGGGKTTVMGMLAAWSILNKIADPSSRKFSDTVLVICPNVTIRDRLQELKPELDELSIYRTRELVPLHQMPNLRRGEVWITNWHHLERRDLSEVNGVSARVVKRGVPVTKTSTKTIEGAKQTVTETRYYESDEAFIKRVLGGRRGRSQSIFVFNDEAHHAYRRGDVDEDEEIVLDRETAQKNDREATVWIEGLDRINKVLGGRGDGIRMCVDLSATPFYIQGSGNEVGKPFPWAVSDFGLLDAIEAGLVKIPQLPTQDVTGSDTPPYFNVWRWVEEVAAKDGHTGAMTPQVIMRYATQPISQLADEWLKTFDAWQEHFKQGLRKSPVPPVFIIVCRDTSLAKEVFEWVAKGNSQYGKAPQQFRNANGKEITVRIDSKVSEDIEAGGGEDETRRLRFVLETIGKTEWPGGKVPEEYAVLVHKHNAKALEDEALQPIDEYIPPGCDIRCIVSVAMLSEGWDATTVTHIVGLRPFGSQLLCEQVVGRALRRTSYVVGDNGRFTEETAKVFGVPFELIPFKVEEGAAPAPTPLSNHIYAVPEKTEFEITFPVVEGYHDPGVVELALEWGRVPTLPLDPLIVPDATLVKGLSSLEGRLSAYGPGAGAIVDLTNWRKRVRVQQVAFDLAAELSRKWVAEKGGAIPWHRLFPFMLGFARKFLAEKLDCKGVSGPQDVALNPYFQRAVSMLFEAMTTVDRAGVGTELPIIPGGRAGVRSTAYVDFHTGRPLWPVNKCHLNAMVADTKRWEQSAAFCFDTHKAVAAWVKNDHLGFEIRYRKDGTPHGYRPDFIVKLVSGMQLMVEVKGEIGDAEIKQAAAQRWKSAVNRNGRFGQWAYEIVFHPADLAKILDRYARETVDA